MRSVLLALLSALNQCVASCPASCMVCSKDAIFCHKLSGVTGIPQTARAVWLTDGQIVSVDGSAFSGLTKMTLLGLSNNNIADILENAFQNLSALKTLLLDHNQLTTSSIPESTFSQLQSLEILKLGNNALRVINGKWFQHTRSLLTLQLEGNLIAQVESGTFRSSDLKNLKMLDLSGNLITFIAKDCFHNLPRLHSIDLSRNSLQSAPDAFSSLPWLSKLNLVLNQWNCTCELLELSSFLRSYLKTPEKKLHNSKELVCLNSANSAVQNVLQLTEDNCMQPNENITAFVKSKDRISKQQYIRDVTLAATFFFAGGVLVIVGIVYCKMELSNHKGALRNRFTSEPKLNQGAPRRGFNDDNKARQQILSITNTGNAKAKPIQLNGEAKSNPRPWLKGMTRQGLNQTRLDYCTVCHSCHQIGLVPPVCHKASSGAIVVQSDSWLATMSGKQNKLAPGEEERERMPRLALKSNEDCPGRGDQSIHQRQYNNGNHGFYMKSTVLHTDTKLHRASKQNLVHISSGNTPKPINSTQSRMRINTFQESFDKFNNHEDKLRNNQTPPDYLITECVHCNQTIEYRQESDRERGKTTEAGMDRMVTQQHKREEDNEGGTGRKQDPTYADHGDDLVRKPCIKPPQRKVSFNLRESGTPKNELHKDAKIQKIKKSDEPKSMLMLSSDTLDEKKGRRKHSVHSNGLLKVKLNLNPFRKSRIHAQKNLSKDERNPNKKEKNRKAASMTAKRAKRSVTAEKGDGGPSKTGDTDTQQSRKQSKNQPKTNTHPQTDTTDASHSQPVANAPNPEIMNGSRAAETVPDGDNGSNKHEMSAIPSAPILIQEYLQSVEGSSKMKIRLILPERTSNGPQTPLDKKIR